MLFAVHGSSVERAKSERNDISGNECAIVQSGVVMCASGYLIDCVGNEISAVLYIRNVLYVEWCAKMIKSVAE